MCCGFDPLPLLRQGLRQSSSLERSILKGTASIRLLGIDASLSALSASFSCLSPTNPVQTLRAMLRVLESKKAPRECSRPLTITSDEQWTHVLTESVEGRLFSLHGSFKPFMTRRVIEEGGRRRCCKVGAVFSRGAMRTRVGTEGGEEGVQQVMMVERIFVDEGAGSSLESGGLRAR